ncbi:MAG TPA: hypothetical protein VGM54_09960 [Chthoniobacter sp.]|jgi:hypothetical protein
MAFNPAPEAWLGTFTSDGTNLTVPIANFPSLTSGEANPSTGDIRKMMHWICETLNAAWVAAGAAGQPVEMQINKGQALNPSTGQITVTYSLTFVLAPTALEVVAEP